MNSKEEQDFKNLKLQNNLFRCLIGILIFEANQGAGDYWRGVFSPNLVELGKKFDVSVATAAEVALPADLLQMAREHLKIELPPAITEEDIKNLKAMLPADLLKRTFVVTVTPRPEPLKALPSSQNGHVVAEPARIPLPPGTDPSSIQFEVERGEKRDPTAPLVSSSRGTQRYCSNCQSFYEYKATLPHTCQN